MLFNYNPSHGELNLTDSASRTWSLPYRTQQVKTIPSFEIGPFDTEEEYNNQVKSRDENDEEDEEDDIFENLEPLSGIPYKIEYIRQSLTSRCKGQNKKTTHKNSLMIVLALVVNAFFHMDFSHLFYSRGKWDRLVQWCWTTHFDSDRDLFRVEWRQVIMGLIIQFLLGLLILRWDFGRNVFDCSSKKVKQFLDFTDQGSSFVYGYLVSGKPLNTDGIKNETFLEELNRINDRFGPVLLFKALSSLKSDGFFKFPWEQLPPLIIKPYLHMMTKSEIHAVMAGGFATIAGSVLAAFIIFGVDATHLLSASIMSAPAALASAKLLYPESKKSKTEANSLMDNFKVKGEATNLLDAATQGAITAVQLVMNICACLIAFLAFIGLLNSLLSWGGNLVGYSDITFEFLLGKLFIPLAWILGCDNKDLHEVGELIGIKSFLTEFVAFQKLGISHTLSRRSRIIATYALCGFANPASMGIQVACLSTMAPTRRRAITNVAIRAYFSGSLACFLTACVAGSLIA
ncbi:SLC28A [Lepeophtheirus salmonis]|uniref:SLC28A n=1 Tax=Lepeophtheirus salmonis TaxID=72036 RepID=A0A7R8HAR3_LEPSM|nr:SLC28A [Lepeophtheirus salmonis]CAF2979323.1 SLC28A [Lepeophtheirus salmonis]